MLPSCGDDDARGRASSKAKRGTRGGGGLRCPVAGHGYATGGGDLEVVPFAEVPISTMPVFQLEGMVGGGGKERAGRAGT